MTSRFSRDVKEKWVSGTHRSRRKSPIRIPEADNSALIEANKLTLIGRVTNPVFQKPRALVDFFLQHWNVVGRITGRDLGPHLFQFNFESEQDLQSILQKAPFHFKKWMLILQKWEPIVSDSFPALIPFWITIHGIPLHFWTDQTLRTIGFELGKLVARDVDKGRVRVLINGLQLLEMKMKIQLPTGEIKEVEFEYEKLEKHCFTCFSLLHDDRECPLRKTDPSTQQSPRTLRNKGITQHKTLDTLEGYRRKSDERRLRISASGDPYQARWPNFRNDSRKELSWIERRAPPQSSSLCVSRSGSHRGGKEPLYEDKDRSNSFRRPADRHLTSARDRSASHQDDRRRLERRNTMDEGHKTSSLAHNSKAANSHSKAANSHASLASHTPSPRPSREVMQSKNTPVDGGSSSLERRSAKERLSFPASKGTLRLTEGRASDSDRLQDLEVRYLEETMQDQLIHSAARPSTSNFKGSSAAGVGQVSPIRTLSEDRRYVFERLGPRHDSSPSSEPDTTTEQAHPSTVAGKRKVGKAAKGTTRKRVVKIPLSGTSLKKRRVSKTQSSPRRKLLPDVQANKNPASAQTDVPTVSIIPAITKKGKGKDFRPPPDSLP